MHNCLYESADLALSDTIRIFRQQSSHHLFHLQENTMAASDSGGEAPGDDLLSIRSQEPTAEQINKIVGEFDAHLRANWPEQDAEDHLQAFAALRSGKKIDLAAEALTQFDLFLEDRNKHLNAEEVRLEKLEVNAFRLKVEIDDLEKGGDSGSGPREGSVANEDPLERLRQALADLKTEIRRTEDELDSEIDGNLYYNILLEKLNAAGEYEDHTDIEDDTLPE